MNEFDQITKSLTDGGIAVVRTDTIYGIIALAANEQAVEKVFKAKNRNPSKQCIVLVANSEDIPQYGEHVAQVSASSATPTSVIIPATSQPEWLLRGGDTIAYRVVRDHFLKSVVASVGPVIAPSANPEGLAPARTVQQAIDYFGDHVDCYVDGGEVPEHVQASQIVAVATDGSTQVIRAA